MTLWTPSPITSVFSICGAILGSHRAGHWRDSQPQVLPVSRLFTKEKELSWAPHSLLQRLCNPISGSVSSDRSKALQDQGASVTITTECKPEKKGTGRRKTCQWLWVWSRSDSAPWTKCAGGVSYTEEEWEVWPVFQTECIFGAPGNLRNGWTVYRVGYNGERQRGKNKTGKPDVEQAIPHG